MPVAGAPIAAVVVYIVPRIIPDHVATWTLHSPSIALDAHGEPRVGYQARDISGGLDNPDPTKPDCEAGTDMTWSRLALMSANE